MQPTPENGRSGVYFLKRFLKDPRHVGSLWPSSRVLGAAMLEDLTFAPGDVLIEYGPGTGSFTQVIQDRLRAEGLLGSVRYLGIEREAGFCDILRQRFPDFRFAHGQVEDVEQLLAEHDLPRPHKIISGLPLILLPNLEEIITTTRNVLQTGGTFRTFSYLQSYPTGGGRRVRATMRAQFDRFSLSRLIVRNFPPAFVLRGDRLT